MPQLRYHHIGIPTSEPLPGATYYPKHKLHALRHFHSEYSVEWLEFDPDSPFPELLKTVAHVAFVVEDMKKAIAGKQIIMGPQCPTEGVTIAFIVDKGAPIEFLQFHEPEAEVWAREEASLNGNGKGDQASKKQSAPAQGKARKSTSR